MDKAKILLLFAFLLIVAILPVAVRVSAEQNATNQTNVSLMSIELSKTDYQPNETLQGKIRIFLNNTVDPSAEIRVRIKQFMGTTERRMTIRDALGNASIVFAESSGEKVASAEADSKTLAFTSGGEHSIAVKLPMFSDIESVDMDISAPSDSQLTDVKMDIGNDGTTEWYYLGDFTGWADQYTTPENFSDAGSSEVVIVDNKSFYCQLIDFPFSVNYTLYANYKKLGSGNISAALFSVMDPGMSDSLRYPLPTGIECDLPELDAYGWGGCPVSTEYGFTGRNFVCIYSVVNNSPELYSVKAHQLPANTAYNCRMLEDESIECQKSTFLKPLIKIKGAKYSKTLNKQVDFKRWQYAPDSVILAFWQVVGSQNPSPPYQGFSGTCQTDVCVIDIKITANGTGQISLGNLAIRYRYQGATSTARTFWYYSLRPPVITHIGSGNASVELGKGNTTIELPLSLFNISAPKPFTSGGYATNVIEALFNGQEADDVFKVYAPGVQVGSEKIITETKNALSGLSAMTDDTKIILKILQYDKIISEAQTKLSSYQAQLASGGDSPQLQAEIEKFREGLPKEVKFEGGFADFVFIEPNDITADIVPAGQKESTYFMQEKAQVKATIISFAVTNFAGTSERYVLVKKELTAKAPLEKVDVYEIIDKAVVDSAADVQFEEPPSKVVKEDPIVKWFISSLSTGSKKSFNYVLKTGFDVSIDNVKTIIALQEDEAAEDMLGGGEAPQSECGDGVCTVPLEDETICPEDCRKESPLTKIIIIVSVSFVLLLYILFYKGKYGVRNLFKGKSPFAAPSQLKLVTDFIADSRAKKMTDEQITKALAGRGWKPAQIKYAFNEIAAMPAKPELKPAAKARTEAKPADAKIIQDYIKVAAAKGMSKETIARNLISKGWNAGIVYKEIGLKK